LRVGSIIEELVVHSSDNNEYLRLSFEKEYHRYGTIFMDYRNTLDDQNIIMYGHYVYYDEDGMFTELHLLKVSIPGVQTVLQDYNSRESFRMFCKCRVQRC